MSNDAISSTYSCAPRLGCPWLGVSLPRPGGGSGSLVLGLRLADGNVLRCSGGGRDGRISRALSVIRSTPCGSFSSSSVATEDLGAAQPASVGPTGRSD